MMEDLNLRKAIELAITTEQLGADFYTRMERKFGDQAELKEVFARLVKDEKAHEAQFQAILELLPDDVDPKRDYEQWQFLRATAISEFFRKDAFKDSDRIDSVDDALGRALSFEKSTLQYYQAIRDLTGESPQLDAIIEAERGHVVSLMRVLMADGKFRGVGDKF
jgi:rubrerythrin